MAEGKTIYKSYLLRLWREAATDVPWRASLESITQEDQQPHHFPNLESLVAFLLAELAAGKAAPPVGGHRGDPSESRTANDTTLRVQNE